MGKKQGGKAMSMPAGIAMGVLAATAVTLLGAVALTSMILGERVSLDAMGYGIMGMEFFAALTGAVTAMLVVKHRKMQVCLLTGAGYFLLLLASNAMFFGGQYDGVLWSGLLILAACGLTALIGNRQGTGRKKRRKIPAYR